MSDGRRLKIVAVGASAGGVVAVRRLLGSLDREFRVPIVIVQHMPATARIDVALVYSTDRSRKVIEVEDKMPLEEGFVYMAAPGYHVLVEKDGTLSLSVDELVNYSRPSIDVLFEAVANSFGSKACGIILTGANSDGAAGLARIGEAGGVTIVQDPKDAETDIMPRAAIRERRPDFILAIDEMAPTLVRLASRVEEAPL